MNKDQIKELLEGAINILLENQPNLFEFTSETNQTEWNIAHHYAIEVHKMFLDYECDLDISKPNLGDRRPDIVIHRRGTHDSNFLVIEVKRSQRDVASDLEKIKSFWFTPHLQYEFGAVVVIEEGGNNSVIVVKNGAFA